MEWKRGKSIGRGSFCSVYLAIRGRDCTLFELPQLMAVKSAAISECSLLQKEKEILDRLRDCPGIVRCLGDDYTVENSEPTYNVFLEYASRGNLADLVKKSGGTLPESDVRRFTRSILIGLRGIHEKGFVHCDIKLQNILVFSTPDGTDDVKIADFGLAKKAGAMEKPFLRGTPLFMSPESIACNEYEAPVDLWSLGCVVAEMVMGRPAWKCRPDTEACALLYRIGFGKELPEIPVEMSEQGKDFLQKCFVRDSSKRWTAEMLLNHPFVADATVSLPQSPKSAFDFPEWSSSAQSYLSNSLSCSSTPNHCLCDQRNSLSSASPVDRIGQLVMEKSPNWIFSDSWIIVRQGKPEAEACSPVSHMSMDGTEGKVVRSHRFCENFVI